MSRNHAYRNTNRKRWAHTRLAVFERDGWRCRKCGRAGRLEADHIEPLKTWPGCPYDTANIQTLCRSCHIAKTAAENRPKPTDEQAKWQALIAEMTDSHDTQQPPL